jgi:FK506-binding protein 1
MIRSSTRIPLSISRRLPHYSISNITQKKYFSSSAKMVPNIRNILIATLATVTSLIMLKNVMAEENQIELTQDGGVKKKIIKPGNGDKTPQKYATVKVNYVGTLTNGKKFDSSRDRRKPLEFKLGVGQVIKGWDIGIASMQKGEVAVFELQPDYAYGKRGFPPVIPPNATLIFEVELIDWQ